MAKSVEIVATPDLIRRFEEKFERGNQDECWIWKGATWEGYGSFRCGRGNVRAHRFAYSAYIGPIEDGLLVLHLCDNPSCVNPGHLKTGTDMDNTLDKLSRGREPRGESNGRAALSEEVVSEIRAAYERGESLNKLSQRFGVRHTTIRSAVYGLTWSHIPGRKRPVGLPKGERQHLAKLTEAEVAEMRRLYIKESWTVSALSRKYSVHYTTARAICFGETWKHLPMPD